MGRLDETTSGELARGTDSSRRPANTMQGTTELTISKQPSVSEIPDSELLKRAARNCRCPTRNRKFGVPLWSVVAGRFALGSTFAIEVCRRFELDPDEMTRARGGR